MGKLHISTSDIKMVDMNLKGCALLFTIKVTTQCFPMLNP